MYDYPPQVVRLASDIADALDDHNSFQLYLQFAAKYEETHLKKILEKVLSIPERKIKKTRGALFTFLVTQYENNNSRD